MEIWRATPEVLAMPLEQRMSYVAKHMVFSSEEGKPFPDGTFDKQAPMSLGESIPVLIFFLFILGCPLSLAASWAYTLLCGTWLGLLGLAAVTAFLSFHPVPDNLSCSRFTLLLYKYFSYRFMWVDDAKDQVEKCRGPEGRGWVGAGAPHGVLPLANFLSMPAINAFTTMRFLGGGASVTMWTPGLRYLGCFGGVTDVSASSLDRATKKGFCVGIVPDGIAGIFQQSRTDAGEDTEERVKLKDRKGLAKLSLRTGIPIVPAYSLGNTKVFSMWHDPFGCMEALSRRLRASVFLFWGRFGLPLPFRTNITMLLGPPVQAAPEEVGQEKPPQEAIDKLHWRILDGISTAFNQHKGACGWQHRQMKFV